VWYWASDRLRNARPSPPHAILSPPVAAGVGGCPPAAVSAFLCVCLPSNPQPRSSVTPQSKSSFFSVVRVRYSAVKTRPTPLPFLLLCITLCPPLGRPSYSRLPFFVRDDVVGQGAALHWTGVDCRDYPSSAVGLLSTASMPPSSDRLELF